ncbi:uncharacterized protein F5147DRAFT_746518 [Suillus discolor]|uniref:Uncharacterized protein n=1 Tax=Suillus discolor TaxID=1912936 RepID=A0A9P7F461_9AGAM|nr:uncharacterized protein F5147DRAFT_746518 [Suillus discolor]KAG2104656.1 hypothetical protein F5147DRAFT_746518 [Suillus discolor]
MVYTVPLIIFMDDVSGNILKQWNKHHTIYMSNANLPREMLEKEFFVRFVTSSPHATPMELMRAMKDSLCNAAQSGVVAWDCKDEEEVMLIPCGLFLAGDNPMQAEECSHAGLDCNYFCRTCNVGGTKEYKASEEGYNSIFKSGSLRTPEKTTDNIQHQFEAAMKSGATTKVQSAISSTGVRDRINIHLDTPTEILHTVLLGVVKYFWGQSVFILEKAKLLHIFQSHLESVDKDGLNAPSLNADYICHYKGGLIGKHFKSLAQVMPFLVYDLVPQTVLNGWSVIRELVVLIWHTTIPDTEEYLHSYVVSDLQSYSPLRDMNHSITFSDCRAFTAIDVRPAGTLVDSSRTRTS